MIALIPPLSFSFSVATMIHTQNRYITFSTSIGSSCGGCVEWNISSLGEGKEKYGWKLSDVIKPSSYHRHSCISLPPPSREGLRMTERVHNNKEIAFRVKYEFWILGNEKPLIHSFLFHRNIYEMQFIFHLTRWFSASQVNCRLVENWACFLL